MAANKSNTNEHEEKPPVPSTEQLLARVYPIFSGRPLSVEPKATDLRRVRPKRRLKKKAK